jgi:hypothetical protein
MCYAKILKVSGSSPDVATELFNLPIPSSSPIALVITQALTQMSTRRYIWSKGLLACKADNLPSMSRLCRQCGILDIPYSYRSPRPVKWIDLLRIRICPVGCEAKCTPSCDTLQSGKVF